MPGSARKKVVDPEASGRDELGEVVKRGFGCPLEKPRLAKQLSI